MILLDTHVWLWLLHEPNQLSTQAQTIINAEELQNGLLVSAISVWEINLSSSSSGHYFGSRINRRSRGVILTLKGWDKLQSAKTQAELTDRAHDGFTLEELSSRMGLSLHTVSRIQGRLEPVDKSSLQSA